MKSRIIAPQWGRALGVALGLALLSGCAASSTSSAPAPASKPLAKLPKGKRPPKFIPAPNRGVTRPPAPRGGDALDQVIGSDARALTQMFGAAQQDVREEGARKLQFGNQLCILDAYLYAPARGKTMVVTYVSARTPDGRDAERNSCILALQQRR
jgi:hypothetical protein